MGQNKLDSFIEAVINVCLGFGISVLANFVIFPLVGITASTNQVMLVGIFMTVVSVARSYFVRRWANTWLVPAKIWVSSIFRKETKMKAEQEDNYEEALSRLYSLTNFLYGGYYEPKSDRDKELADALHDLWVKIKES